MMDYVKHLPPKFGGYAKDFFSCSVDYQPLTAGATSTENFVVQNDADFLACGLAGIARNNGALATVVDPPPVTVRIEDTGSGRNIENRAIDWGAIIGTAKRPLWMPYPKIIDAGATVAVTLAHLDGAGTDYRVSISFLGFKIFGFKEGT